MPRRNPEPSAEVGLPRVYAYCEDKYIVISLFRDKVKRFIDYLSREEAESLVKDLKMALKKPL